MTVELQQVKIGLKKNRRYSIIGLCQNLSPFIRILFTDDTTITISGKNPQQSWINHI